MWSWRLVGQRLREDPASDIIYRTQTFSVVAVWLKCDEVWSF